jgi:hypothetical protein
MHTASDSAATGEKKPRLLGINHVALEVGDLDGLGKSAQALQELAAKGMTPE